MVHLEKRKKTIAAHASAASMTEPIPRKKNKKTIEEHLLKRNEVTQDEPDFDKKTNFSPTVDGKTSHPLLDTPPKCDNKHKYPGSKKDETPVSLKSHTVSMKSHPGVLKKDYLDILRTIETGCDFIETGVSSFLLPV